MRERDLSKREKSIVTVYLPRQTWKQFQALAEHRGQSASGLLTELLDDITGQDTTVQEMRYTLPAKLRYKFQRASLEERQTVLEACLGLLKPTLGLGRVAPKNMDCYTLVIRCAPPAPRKTILMKFLGWRLETLRREGKLDPMTEADLDMIRGVDNGSDHPWVPQWKPESLPPEALK